MSKKKKSDKRAAAFPKRVVVTARLPVPLAEALEEMGTSVGMSRNAVITLILGQAAAMHEATKGSEFGLFNAAEQFVEQALTKAIRKEKRS